SMALCALIWEIACMTHPSSAFRILTEQSLPHGWLAAVSLPSPDSHAQALAALDHSDRALPTEERELAGALGEIRRAAFVGGRLALRVALARAAPDAGIGAVLRTRRG